MSSVLSLRPRANWRRLKRLLDAISGWFEYLGRLVILFSQTVVWAFVPPYGPGKAIHQLVRIGIDSLGIVSLVALFTGMIMAVQTAYQMQKVSAEMYISSLVALSLVRELGPVLTALIVAGRAGGAVTAEIASMRITEQIDALRALAVNPIKYLVVPRFIAFLVGLPILVVIANMIGIMGGYYVCVYNLSIPSQIYINTAFSSIMFKDLVISLVKSVTFAVIIAIISCEEGLNASGGAEGVGAATMRSVVLSFITIIAADWVLSTIFYFIF